MERRKIDIKRVFQRDDICEKSEPAAEESSMDWARRVSEEEARGLD